MNGESGESTVGSHEYDFDLVVIGGGSGGLAASKEAASLGAKVAVCDFVQPTPIGTSWGLGGTCVNVGCIPKKLMHQSSLLREGMTDARNYGWEFPQDSEIKHNWITMVSNIQNYIGSLNFKYRVALRDKNVSYHNAFASFVEPHKLKLVNKRGKESFITADKVVIAVGGRPKYPDIPGAKEYGITSDDIFSLKYPPGKTLCVGASYVSLECAGFLQGCGYPATVMARSILLRGFDQQMAEKIGSHMSEKGIKFMRPMMPTRIEKLKDGEPGLYRVYAAQTGGNEEIHVGDFNTVMFAIGRTACTSTLQLDIAGVKTNPDNAKVLTVEEQSTAQHVYAIGDVIDGKPELTPVAIAAGKSLAQRLFNPKGGRPMDYVNVPTTVFTPIEYGAIGYTEEDAIKKFGDQNIEVFHTLYRPLEWTVAQREEEPCYAKLVCNKTEDMRIIGFHVLGPNAGEITQGYAVALKLGATKQHFDDTVGIHPTCSESLVVMDTTKSSGVEVALAGC